MNETRRKTGNAGPLPPDMLGLLIKEGDRVRHTRRFPGILGTVKNCREGLDREHPRCAVEWDNGDGTISFIEELVVVTGSDGSDK